VAEIEAQDERLMNRVVWRVMPLVTLCYVFATLDRSNIGFAKLTMAKSLGMTEAVFSLGSSLFFLGYLALEVPSTLAAHRYGSRLWFARIMVTWGVATLLLGFASSAPAFYALRFALGAAEAGLYPAALYYMTFWFPRRSRAQAMGFLTIGSAIGNGSGALISGALLDLDGTLGLQGWQWVFLVTGALPILAAPLILRWLDDRPQTARFLSEAEKARVAALVAADRQPDPTAHSGLWSAMVNLPVLGLSLVYILILTALYGVIYWSPTVIREFAANGSQTGLLSVAPYALTAVLLILIPPRLKQRRHVLGAMAVIGIVGAAAFAVAAVVDDVSVRYATLVLGTPCISLVLACFWTFPMQLFGGVRSAAAIGAISTLGNLGGFVAQNLMPALAKAGGGASAALWAPSVFLVLIGLGAAALLTAPARPLSAAL
jgi:sugar phosphate permease